MANKLTQEELDNLIKARQTYFNLKDEIADIVINQERLRNQKQQALINIDLAFTEFSSIQNEIHSKYGEGRVNLQTGEINP